MIDKQQSKNIVIVGGSLSGLCAGVVLKRNPAIKSITILERYQEQQLQDQGAGLRVTPEFIELLSTYANTRPEKYAIVAKAYRVWSLNGDIKSELPIEGYMSSWGQCFRALREKFDTPASSPSSPDENTAKCVYRHGCKVLEVHDTGSGTVELTIEDLKKGGEHETITADLVIGADGASSHLRHIFQPEATRKYVGYVVLRGLVPTEELSPETLDKVADYSSFTWNKDSQMLSFCVPQGGYTIEKSSRALNWGWYWQRTEDKLQDLMTDQDGHHHFFSLPLGKMRPELEQRVRDSAQGRVPPHFVEVVQKTEHPFVQVITDSIAHENVFMDGKVLLVGDAVGGQRPHTASATSQCAFHALLLGSYLEGKISLEDWSQSALQFSHTIVEAGQILGTICMTTDVPAEEKHAVFLKEFGGVSQKLAKIWKDFQIKAAQTES